VGSIKIHIRIYDENDNVIGEDVAPASVISDAVFEISEYLQFFEKANVDIFSFEGKDIIETNLSRLFKLEMFETRNFETTEYDNEMLDNIYVIQQGFSKSHFDNYQKTPLEVAGNFLTWQPEKKINRNEFDILYFLNKSEQSLKSRIKVFFSDDTQQIIYSEEWTLCAAYKIYQVNSSFKANELDALETSEKKIVKYEFSISQISGSTRWIDRRTYLVTDEFFINQKQFFIRNSFGGYDVINFKGVSSKEHGIERITDTTAQVTKIHYASFTESRKANSGWLSYSYTNASAAKDYMTELANSVELYEIVGFYVIPILMTTDKYKIRRTDDFNFSLEIEYQFAFTDQSYSPFDANIAIPGDFNSDFSNDFFI
jgi:hypothetical protein